MIILPHPLDIHLNPKSTVASRKSGTKEIRKQDQYLYIFPHDNEKNLKFCEHSYTTGKSKRDKISDV